MAPELGLFLDECVFKSYNDRWGNDREAQVSLGDFQEQVDAFKVRATSKKHASAAMDWARVLCSYLKSEHTGVIRCSFFFRPRRLPCMLC